MSLGHLPFPIRLVFYLAKLIINLALIPLRLFLSEASEIDWPATAAGSFDSKKRDELDFPIVIESRSFDGHTRETWLDGGF